MSEYSIEIKDIPFGFDDRPEKCGDKEFVPVKMTRIALEDWRDIWDSSVGDDKQKGTCCWVKLTDNGPDSDKGIVMSIMLSDNRTICEAGIPFQSIGPLITALTAIKQLNEQYCERYKIDWRQI